MFVYVCVCIECVVICYIKLTFSLISKKKGITAIKHYFYFVKLTAIILKNYS